MMALVDAIGMALLHAVWQLTLLALVLWVLLRLLESGTAVARYWLSTVALLLALVIFVLTVALLWDPDAATVRVLSVLPELVESAAVTTPWQLTDVSPFLVGLWSSGVAVFSLLLLHGLHQTGQLRTVAVEPVSAELQRKVDSLVERLGMRHPVSVLHSGLADVPMVVGALKPVILLPGIALTGLSSEQLASVLLHELAHIRRRDLLVNLLQGLVEIVLFYHPAVWWISRRIRVERELCCDDVVTEHAEPIGYARALLFLEEHRERSVALAVAATDGSLKHRIARLVGSATTPQRSSRGLSAMTVLSLAVLLPAGQSVAQQDEPDLTVLMSDFLVMQIAVDAGKGSREEEDRSLREDLTAMAAAHDALQDRMAALQASDPSRWELVVRVRGAQAYEHLGLTIKHSDIPSYLTPVQIEAYQTGLDGKSDQMLARAQEGYESALQYSMARSAAASLDESALIDEAEAGAQRMASLRGVGASR